MKWKGMYKPHIFGEIEKTENHICTEVIEERIGKKIIQTRIPRERHSNPNQGIDASAFKLEELIKTGNFIKSKPYQENDMDMQEKAETAFTTAVEKAKINEFMNN